MSLEKTPSHFDNHDPRTLEPDCLLTRECTAADHNNNKKDDEEQASGHLSGFTSPTTTSPVSSDDPLKILNRGPDYLRARIFQRQSGFDRQMSSKSAAELLQESKRRFLQLESEPSRVTSSHPSNFKANNEEEMSSESGLVESMVTKLCIPKTESAAGTASGTALSPGTAQSTNPPALLRTVMGKRRMCTKADDTYGGQKQRQRLGSAEMTGLGGAQDNVIPTEEGEDEFGEGTRSHDRQFPTVSASGCFCQIPSNAGHRPWGEFSSEKQSAGESGEANQWMGSCDKEGKSKLYGPHAAGDPVLDESMDVQVEPRNFPSTRGVKHRCGGALCRGVENEAESADLKIDGEETDAKTTFAVGHRGAGEWREMKGDCMLGNERSDDVKGIRMFRRYKKVVGKSGSRSDLMNRLSNASEQGNSAARNSADLDAFFSEMGMDRNAIESVLTESNMDHTLSTTSLNVFENISSIGTPLDSRSCTSRDSQPMDDNMSKSLDFEQPGLGMSVVERNARVIRWLCNIRRVSTLTDDGEV